MRHDLGVAETLIRVLVYMMLVYMEVECEYGPGLKPDATSMEERCKSMDIDGNGSWVKVRQESCYLNFVEQDQDRS